MKSEGCWYQRRIINNNGPTSTLDKEAQLHLPADPTARPLDVSYKPNCDCHPSKVFSMIGYDITITNATPPPPSNQVLPSSIDCITNYTANADLSLQDHERNKLNRPNNRRTTPPISSPQPNDPHSSGYRCTWANRAHVSTESLRHTSARHTLT